MLGVLWPLHHLCYSKFAVTHMGNKQLSKASHRGAKFGREAGEKKEDREKKKCSSNKPC